MRRLQHLYSSVSGKKVRLASNTFCMWVADVCAAIVVPSYRLRASACLAQIKLKLEQSKEDKLAASRRQQLLAFLNSSTD